MCERKSIEGDLSTSEQNRDGIQSVHQGKDRQCDIEVVSDGIVLGRSPSSADCLVVGHETPRNQELAQCHHFWVSSRRTRILPEALQENGFGRTHLQNS